MNIQSSRRVHRGIGGAWSAIVLIAAVGASAPSFAAPTTLKGAAILDTPCGKTAIKQMGLLHDGNIAEANKLTTPDMQKRWASMPPKDQAMMTDMAKSMSPTSAAYAAAIRASGEMVVDGNTAHLKVTQTTKDANGSSTSTTEQSFALAGGQCLVSR